MPFIVEFKNYIRKKITKKCNSKLEIIEKFIEVSKEDEDKTFFLKKKGDYLRWNADCLEGEKLKIVSDKCLKAYEGAKIFAEKLPLTNEIRLGLFLNMSVLYYGNIKDHQKAKKITKSVIEEVKGPIQKLDEEENKGIIRIYNLLKENLDMWEEE